MIVDSIIIKVGGGIREIPRNLSKKSPERDKQQSIAAKTTPSSETKTNDADRPSHPLPHRKNPSWLH